MHALMPRFALRIVRPLHLLFCFCRRPPHVARSSSIHAPRLLPSRCTRMTMLRILSVHYMVRRTLWCRALPWPLPTGTLHTDGRPMRALMPRSALRAVRPLCLLSCSCKRPPHVARWSSIHALRLLPSRSTRMTMHRIVMRGEDASFLRST